MMTKLYAVIGSPISHSKSPDLMNHAFKQLSMNAYYSRILTDRMDDLEDLRSNIPFFGFNITAPLKSEAVHFCDMTTMQVEQTRACNTIVFNKHHEKIGFNTDVQGVANSILKRRSLDALKDFKVLIIGTGGAASAALSAMIRYQAQLIVAGRNRKKPGIELNESTYSFIGLEELPPIIQSFDIIINTLPLFISVFKKFEFRPGQIVMDAAYKLAPLKKQAEQCGAEYIDGLEWLIEQAIEAFNLFSDGLGIEADLLAEEIENTSEKSNKHNRIVLTGPMAAGKTTLAKSLADKLQFEYIDLDQMVEEKMGKSISRIFSEEGEAVFRQKESEIFLAQMGKENVVISTGGGIVSQKENREMMKDAHVVFLYLTPELTIERAKRGMRPLLEVEEPVVAARRLFEERMNHYIKTADIIVSSCKRTKEELLTLVYEDYRQTFLD